MLKGGAEGVCSDGSELHRCCEGNAKNDGRETVKQRQTPNLRGKNMVKIIMAQRLRAFEKKCRAIEQVCDQSVHLCPRLRGENSTLCLHREVRLNMAFTTLQTDGSNYSIGKSPLFDCLILA